ncbi:MAG: M24 family metallopeptidase [Candidatus Competibacteraceae bacterium]|nr:M24 family metallopeptidase [Candidatus Competibacteraceae bacterium]
MALPFELAEYRERVARTKAKMDEHNLDVLMVTDPSNMNYLTGYDGWSFYVPQVVIVAQEEDQPLWIGRKMDANGARATTWLAEDNIYAYSDHYVHTDERHPMDYVAHVMKERRLDRRNIGLKMDSYYFSPAAYQCLGRNLPRANLIDHNLLVPWLRVIKSPRELEYMRQAGRICERVMQTAIDSVRPGVRQCDAVADIYHAQISGTAEFGGDYPAIAPMLPTGKGTSTPHLTWTDQPFVRDEATILEIAACRLRYHAPMARTVYLGKPPQKLQEMAAIVMEGIGAALETVRPGMTCEEVEKAWADSIARHGIYKESRIGYSMGLNYPPDWGEHTASLRPGDRTVLEPNMTFHMIPGIWMDDWGIEISESFVVTDHGYELLAHFPRQLLVKD